MLVVLALGSGVAAVLRPRGAWQGAGASPSRPPTASAVTMPQAGKAARPPAAPSPPEPAPLVSRALPAAGEAPILDTVHPPHPPRRVPRPHQPGARPLPGPGGALLLPEEEQAPNPFMQPATKAPSHHHATGVDDTSADPR
jgi:hypothetical protein